MQINEFLDLVHRRRSVRKLKPDPFPDEWVEKILEAGRWAMSGCNAQPWEFIVVKNNETKRRMAEFWSDNLREMEAIEMTRLPEFRHPLFLRPHALPNWKDAPVLIVVCGDRRTLQATILAVNFIGAEGGMGADASFLKAMANPCQIMHLAAASLGLASHWLSVERIFEQQLRSLFDVPPLLEVHSIVVLGYPAFEAPPPYRRALKEIVHYEKYDRSKYRSGQDVIDSLRMSRENVRTQEQAAYELKTWDRPDE